MSFCKNLIMATLFFTLLACNPGSVIGDKYDLKGYYTDNIGGSAISAIYLDEMNLPLSKGHVIGGVRTGAWTTYHPNSNKIKTITNYINGKKNGPELTFSERGQIEVLAEYRNDALHGLSANYRNGRTLNETTYLEGVMDGPFAIYDDSNGKIQRSGYFKNGKQHGEFLFYDGNGNITLRYEYENGEKVSGGIVE